MTDEVELRMRAQTDALESKLIAQISSETEQILEAIEKLKRN